MLIEKRESGMALKKREFTPESGNVDTYAIDSENIIQVDMFALKLRRRFFYAWLTKILLRFLT